MLVHHSIIAAVLAALAVIGAIVFMRVRSSATRAYGLLRLAEGDEIGPANVAYQKLDRKQLNVAIFISGCYALGLINMTMLAVTRTNVFLMVLLTIAAVGTSVFATIKSNQDFRLSREAEDVHRQRRLQSLRAQLLKNS